MSAKRSKPGMLRSQRRTQTRVVGELVSRLMYEATRALINGTMNRFDAREHVLRGLAEYIARQVVQRVWWRMGPFVLSREFASDIAGGGVLSSEASTFCGGTST